MKKLPGQPSSLALFTSILWTVLSLLILIIGHLVWVFVFFGLITHTDAIKDLELFLPLFKPFHLYILAGLALIADIWIFISHKKERAHKIKR